MNYDELTKEFMRKTFLSKPPYRPMLSLSRGEMGTLLFLVKAHDHSSAGDIADRICLTSGRMASVLKSLERKELIIKKKDEDDKRKTIVSSTKKGQDLVHEHSQKVYEHIHNLLRFLGEEDAKNFVRINVMLSNEFDPQKKY